MIGWSKRSRNRSASRPWTDEDYRRDNKHTRILLFCMLIFQLAILAIAVFSDPPPRCLESHQELGDCRHSWGGHYKCTKTICDKYEEKK